MVTHEIFQLWCFRQSNSNEPLSNRCRLYVQYFKFKKSNSRVQTAGIRKFNLKSLLSLDKTFENLLRYIFELFLDSNMSGTALSQAECKLSAVWNSAE